MNSIDARIAQLFETVFGVDTVSDSTSITTLEEWDSGSHITLVLQLEEDFDVTISTDEAIEMTSVADIKKVLASKGINT